MRVLIGTIGQSSLQSHTTYYNFRKFTQPANTLQDNYEGAVHITITTIALITVNLRKLEVKYIYIR